MALPYEDVMSAAEWCDKEPVPKKHVEENSPAAARSKATVANSPQKKDTTSEENMDDGLEGTAGEEDPQLRSTTQSSIRKTNKKKASRKNPVPPTRREWSDRGNGGGLGIRHWQKQQHEKRLKPWDERQLNLTARREKVKRDKQEDARAEETAREAKPVDSDDDQTKTKKAAPEKAKNDIALRKGRSTTVGAGGDGGGSADDDTTSADINDDAEAQGDPETDGGHRTELQQQQPVPFPTRLWGEKKDYSIAKQKKDDEELEQKREAATSTRIPPPKIEHAPLRSKTFVNPVHKAEWNEKLPDVIDFRYLPKKPNAEVDATVERLVKPFTRKPEKVREPTPPLEEEEEQKLLARLVRPRREFDKEAEERPKHSIIQPTVMEDEDLDRVVLRLATPQRSSKKKKDSDFRSSAADKPRCEAQQQKEIVGRLYDCAYVSKRDQKALGRLGGIQGEGWLPGGTTPRRGPKQEMKA